MVAKKTSVKRGKMQPPAGRMTLTGIAETLSEKYRHNVAPNTISQGFFKGWFPLRLRKKENKISHVACNDIGLIEKVLQEKGLLPSTPNKEWQ
jgi:hypothetical protein